MNLLKIFSKLLFIGLVCIPLYSCEPTLPIESEKPLVVQEDLETLQERVKSIRANTAAQVIDGLTLELWATDSLAPDPVAMSIDDAGAIYLTQTSRRKRSEIDIRGHRDWMTASIAMQSIEDRRSFLKEVYATEKSGESDWLQDHNKDGIYDWTDLAVLKEAIWKLEDTDKDGLADKSTRILHDFNEEITDVAGALLVREDDVFMGVGPDMWRLKDENGDGVLENKTSISHGYAVHIGFGGHNMSGAIQGPDGKIYWGIGDIGSNITTAEGVNHKHPNQGIIVRANPDGSNFEVFAKGLRNTHEFVFDDYGNIITSDNDGDHKGEMERLVYIVDGSDAGWRINWQFGKYTDPKNNGYKVWMDEELFKPRWKGQAAYIIPPIKNFHNGPTGMAYNPGTGLGSKWLNKFFLVEFKGSPSQSKIWAFDLKPSGASFEFNSEQEIISGVLPTGLRFGPDGALYFSDWINGWMTKDYGRVWKLDVAESENDLVAERRETQRLMQLSYKEQSIDTLTNLLNYGDQRIRLKAQFELVERRNKGTKALQKAIDQKENQLARVHGIWGIGQLAAKKDTRAKRLVPLLKDSDPEIVAQAAKVIGDLNYAKAGNELIPLLTHDHPRVQFFGAQALGRIKYNEAIDPLLAMLKANNDKDVYIRHAGVLALSRIGNAERMIALSKDKNTSLRLAAILVLRRLEHPGISEFLNDADAYLVTEAARAINDDWSIEEALPQLAELLNEQRFTSEPLLRRAINANLRVGGEKELNQVLRFAQRATASLELRQEAIAAIATWNNPSVLDRVDGRYRGEIKRNLTSVKKIVAIQLKALLQEKNSDLLVSIIEMLSNLEIASANSQLAKILSASKNAKVRSTALDALVNLKHEYIEEIIRVGMNDNDVLVRTTALKYLNQLEISKQALPNIVKPIFRKGTLKEQQQVIAVLGEMPVENIIVILEGLIDQMLSEKLTKGVLLELTETIHKTKSEELIAKLQPLTGNMYNSKSYSETVYGGDVKKGEKYFLTNSAGQCIRCHKITGNDVTVGPNLAQIADILSREQLLEALVVPSERLSPGFGMVSLTLKDGKNVTGTLLEETETSLVVRTSEEPLTVQVSNIETRENMASSMPPMGAIMNKREIRDMVAFLTAQKASN